MVDTYLLGLLGPAGRDVRISGKRWKYTAEFREQAARLANPYEPYPF